MHEHPQNGSLAATQVPIQSQPRQHEATAQPTPASPRRCSWEQASGDKTNAAKSVVRCNAEWDISYRGSLGGSYFFQ